ncbi:prepilin-type N-terminal cleavage/methylation domain-containing protein [Desulfosporosinus sp. OT]|uniref:type II secretion system protein n=1 Tax=Desulfosporosinus sp. OT TaxID=913865 RepID=UPI000223ABCD|nr:prepilin-type N-terminal cleavage/methylation domain-containing protein [Desulfosporosinus sp. OT]EGW40306.1 prepilin-type N-terminal cleavage/methylation domain protein [Desulfosporosinus sp. OT]
MNNIKGENGFTLIEVLAVIIIIGVLGAIVIPKLGSSTANARRKADVATAHEVKAALDRFQLETGMYPKDDDLTVTEGTVTSPKLIPKYISTLDKSTTQQIVPEENKGFGVVKIEADATDPTDIVIPDTKTNTIMIYLFSDGFAAEVRAYDESLDNVLWTSAN